MELTVVIQQLGLLLIAFVLAIPCAWDREKESRSAGLRTLPLVAIGACGFLLVGESFLEDKATNARLMQGLIGGLGFLGGGAILKGNNGVVGMASAVTIWITGAIGMAVAYHRFEIAVTFSILNFFTLRLGTKVKNPLVFQLLPSMYSLIFFANLYTAQSIDHLLRICRARNTGSEGQLQCLFCTQIQ